MFFFRGSRKQFLKKFFFFLLLSKFQIYFNFTSFPVHVLFLSQDLVQGAILHILIMSPISLRLCGSFSAFPYLSQPWQLGGIMVRHLCNVPKLRFVWYFPHDYSGAFDFQKECHRGEVPSHAIKRDACDPHNITVPVHVHPLVKMVSPECSTGKSLFFPFHTIRNTFLSSKTKDF